MNKYLALGIVRMIESQHQEWKNEIEQKYWDSVNLPRKKKKQLRKQLQAEWGIANFNPFEY